MLSHGLRYAWFIVVPPMLLAVLGVLVGFLIIGGLSQPWIYGCGGLAVLSFLILHSKYSRMQARIAQHIVNHKNAETSSAPFVLLLRSFSRRSGYSIEESGQVLLAGTPEIAYEQHLVISFLGNLDLSLRKHGLTIVVIGQNNLSLPERHHVLIVECPDDLWQANLRILACNAKAILLIPETTNSVAEEIDYVKRHGLLGRTMLLMPPVNEQTKHVWWVQEINFQRTEQRDQRWEQVKEFLGDRGVVLPPYDPAGALFTVGESGGALKIVTLDGKDDVDAFDLAFRQVLPILSGEWLPLKAVYEQLVPGKRYLEYDPIIDELPGETLPFAAAYVSCMLTVIPLGVLTASLFAYQALGRYLDNSILEIVGALLIHLSALSLVILSMGAYIRWVFSKRSRGVSGDA